MNSRQHLVSFIRLPLPYPWVTAGFNNSGKSGGVRWETECQTLGLSFFNCPPKKVLWFNPLGMMFSVLILGSWWFKQWFKPGRGIFFSHKGQSHQRCTLPLVFFGVNILHFCLFPLSSQRSGYTSRSYANSPLKQEKQKQNAHNKPNLFFSNEENS